MPYDSDQVDETLWNQLKSLNPDLAEKDNKVIDIRNHLKKGGKDDQPRIR